MDFRVLGPLEVSAAGEPLALGGRKQRAVLALLLLNANEVVTRERLIDEVWGAEPPAEADASLRVYVARLRKILSGGSGAQSALETRPRGYVLRIEPQALDLNRFRRLVRRAEEALAAGRAAEASDALAEALGLWRGPALGDLGDDEWARRESALLEELRLHALEERISADLAVARHPDLVPELEALVAQHPYRERLVGQLMVALYRSGRQTEALQAYSSARDVLRDEFGLAPTRDLRDLERQILVQDAALDLPQSSSQEPAGPRQRRTRTLAVLATAAAAVVLAATLLSGVRNGSAPSARPVVLRGNSLVAIDESRNAVLGEVALGGRPSGVAAGEGSVWVGNRDDETLLRIDPGTRKVVRTIGLPVEPSEVAVGGGSVWIFSRTASVVLEIDPALNEIVETIPVRDAGSLCCLYHLAFARGAVWAALGGRVTRIDAETLTRTKPSFGLVWHLVSAANELWAVTGIEGDGVQRLLPLAAPTRFEHVGRAVGLTGLAAGANALWVVSPDGTLAEIDPDLGRVTASVPLRQGISGLSANGRAVWVLTQDGSVLRIDPATVRVVKSFALGLAPSPASNVIAASGDTVWIATDATLNR